MSYDILDIPMDTTLHNLIKNLPVQDIIHLCKTNPIYSDICEMDEMWIYLLNRDYDINYRIMDTDLLPREYYKTYYNTRDIKIQRYTENITIDNLLRLATLVISEARTSIFGLQYITHRNDVNLIDLNIQHIWNTILSKLSKQKIKLMLDVYNIIVQNIQKSLKKIYFFGNTFVGNISNDLLFYSINKNDTYSVIKRKQEIIIDKIFYLGLDHYKNLIADPYGEIIDNFDLYIHLKTLQPNLFPERFDLTYLFELNLRKVDFLSVVGF